MHTNADVLIVLRRTFRQETKRANEIADPSCFRIESTFWNRLLNFRPIEYTFFSITLVEATPSLGFRSRFVDWSLDGSGLRSLVVA